MRQHAAGKSPESESTGLPAFVSATEAQSSTYTHTHAHQ